MKKKFLVAAAALAALMVPQVAGAEGFGIVEWSAEGVAMGGARMFAEDDVSMVAANPASLTKFHGKGMGLNATYISPHGSYEATPTSTESLAASKGFLSSESVGVQHGQNRVKPGIVPGMYYVQQMTDKDWWGIGCYTRYGMVSGFQPGSRLASNNLFTKMDGLSLTPVYAHKFDKKWSAAVGLEINYVGLEMNKDFSGLKNYQTLSNTLTRAEQDPPQGYGRNNVANALGITDKKLQELDQGVGTLSALSQTSTHLKGNSFALGWNVSGNYSFDDKNEIGVVYRSKVKHSLEADFYVYGAAAGASGYAHGEGYGEVTLPDQWTIGYNHKFGANDRIELNATRTNWSTYDWLNINVSGTGSAAFDRMHESYKGYNNTWRYAIGYEHKFSEKYSGMLGFAFDQGGIPYEGGDCMVPTGLRRTYSCGLQYHDKKQTVAVAIAWEDIGGLDFAGNGTTDAYGTVHTHDNSAKVFSLGYSFKF